VNLVDGLGGLGLLAFSRRLFHGWTTTLACRDARSLQVPRQGARRRSVLQPFLELGVSSASSSISRRSGPSPSSAWALCSRRFLDDVSSTAPTARLATPSAQRDRPSQQAAAHRRVVARRPRRARSSASHSASSCTRRRVVGSVLDAGLAARTTSCASVTGSTAMRSGSVTRTAARALDDRAATCGALNRLDITERATEAYFEARRCGSSPAAPDVAACHRREVHWQSLGLRGGCVDRLRSSNRCRGLPARDEVERYRARCAPSWSRTALRCLLHRPS
jgi:hypothetical protein